MRLRGASSRLSAPWRSEKPRFGTDDVEIGAGVVFGRNVRFSGGRVRIGDGAIIGDNVLVETDTFELGDFGTVYTDCFFPGPGSVVLGHNFWMGRGAILDGMGGATIGDSVCVAAYSQLWTHMVFGDVLAGCRFNSVGPLAVGDDVWFGPQCLVSPIRAGDRSLAMMGSVVTSDMDPDHCYAGVPAVDITEKLGPQFAPRPVEDRLAMLDKHIAEFASREGRSPQAVAVAVADWDDASGDDGITVFNVSERTYRKTATPLERRLIHFLLPEAKFTPKA